MIDFLPISGSCPVIITLWQKLRIILQRIMYGIEKIFTIQLYKREKRR